MTPSIIAQAFKSRKRQFVLGCFPAGVSNAPDLLEQARASVSTIEGLEIPHRLVVQAALLQKAEDMVLLLAEAAASPSPSTLSRRKDSRPRAASSKRATRKRQGSTGN